MAARGVRAAVVVNQGRRNSTTSTNSGGIHNNSSSAATPIRTSQSSSSSTHYPPPVMDNKEPRPPGTFAKWFGLDKSNQPRKVSTADGLDSPPQEPPRKSTGEKTNTSGACAMDPPITPIAPPPNPPDMVNRRKHGTFANFFGQSDKNQPLNCSGLDSPPQGPQRKSTAIPTMSGACANPPMDPPISPIAHTNPPIMVNGSPPGTFAKIFGQSGQNCHPRKSSSAGLESPPQYPPRKSTAIPTNIGGACAMVDNSRRFSDLSALSVFSPILEEDYEDAGDEEIDTTTDGAWPGVTAGGTYDDSVFGYGAIGTKTYVINDRSPMYNETGGATRTYLLNDESPIYNEQGLRSTDRDLLLQSGSRVKAIRDYGAIEVDPTWNAGDNNNGDSKNQGGTTCVDIPETEESGRKSGPPSEPPKSKKWTKRQWQILVVMLIATCASSFAVCLFPPFFPRLAEEKGQSAGCYGFVIGTNCLTSFLVTPLLGKSLNKIGVKPAFVMGMLIGGIMCGVSGLLEFFPPDWTFVATAVFIRMVHATGNAMVIVATFSYSAVEFGESVGTIFSLTRTAMNFAQLLGPSLGGAIYELDGFYLPFVTMGGVQVLMGIFLILALPDAIENNAQRGNSQASSPDGSPAKEVTIRNVLRIPTIWFSFLTFVVATMCNGFLSINLEPKLLRHFDLSPVYVGLIFGLKDGANSLLSPVWGLICDRAGRKSVKPYVIFSAFLVGCSFFLMGAGAFIGIPVEKSMEVLVFALALNGVGIGGEQVAGVVDALHEAIAAGYPDDPSMHGLIAGLWSSLSGAGRFVSRVGSGFLVDNIGFDATAFIVTLLQVMVAVSMTVYYFLFEFNKDMNRSVHWRDVTTIDEQRSHGGEEGSSQVGRSEPRRIIFTQNTSPSDSQMAKTVSIDMPNNWNENGLPARAVSSMPPVSRLPIYRQPSEAGSVDPFEESGGTATRPRETPPLPILTTRRTSTVGLVARSLLRSDNY